MELTPDKNAKVFKAFCDEKRLAILELLRSGEKCACVLIEQMEIGQSSLSYHMKILCDSGIVESRQEGKWTHYKISEQGSYEAMLLLKAITTPNATATDTHCCN
ncbi:ArsR family transcriptional regulator [Lachnotalea glycerini]|uniref:ArsR family transcriptional regulator n=1 Tax=Lachnotalea glycerini TaxID=1763509 RepID=A0A255SB50_9FIRM|nr:metalloregulator ArsR/SmtB family transcription factor [Lachnotalea glycerini]OYP49897.1 transcriptional regulator [Lachnotalea glycerini]PXV89409.1 ArsR family transcriptional regulator [Lachnotalea glycerini]RDY32402.1 ArsR family transcriptional regulator [Lachnotalea glycerini]